MYEVPSFTQCAKPWKAYQDYVTWKGTFGSVPLCTNSDTRIAFDTSNSRSFVDAMQQPCRKLQTDHGMQGWYTFLARLPCLRGHDVLCSQHEMG
jgi:hypothetical protein